MSFTNFGVSLEVVQYISIVFRPTDLRRVTLLPHDWYLHRARLLLLNISPKLTVSEKVIANAS